MDTPDALKQQVGGDVASVCTDDNERGADILNEGLGVYTIWYRDVLQYVRDTSVIPRQPKRAISGA